MNKGTSYRPIRQIQFSVSDDFSTIELIFFALIVVRTWFYRAVKKKQKSRCIDLSIEDFILNFNCSTQGGAITAFTLCEGFVPDLRGGV